jgi:histidinol-phosphate aminotransferase
VTTLIKLDSNENPFGPSPLAIKAMQPALAASNAYPDDDVSGLRRKLAGIHRVSTEQILVTSGLTRLLGMLAQTFLSHGLNAVTSERSFIVYRMAAQAAHAQLIELPMDQERFDLSAIASRVNKHTRIVFLANPNNPTSTLVTAEEVDHFLQRLPDHVVAVLDEAYHEFAADFAAMRTIEYSRGLDYVRNESKVVVLRTFSKVHGLAGVRVGYGIASAKLIAQISRRRDVYGVSNLAQAAALAALGDQPHIRRAVENNSSEAKKLCAALSELGYAVPVPWANFLYCQLSGDARVFAERLQREGVLVRALDRWGDPRAIRITIGTPEQNHELLRALRKLKHS